MMTPRSTESLMKTLDLMLEAVIDSHQSHESRNKELSVIRGMLDNWLKDFNRYQSTEDEKAEARQTLEAVYQLCIWTLEHETHTCVKSRLYLARSVIRQYFGRVNIAELLKRAEFQRKYGTKTVEALEIELQGDDLVPVPDNNPDYPF